MEFVSGPKMLILDLAVIIQKNMIGEIIKDLSSEFWVLEQIQLPWSDLGPVFCGITVKG